jgi:hypothetical protein
MVSKSHILVILDVSFLLKKVPADNRNGRLKSGLKLEFQLIQGDDAPN